MIKLIYSTWPTKELALRTAESLVQENLVACSNILGAIDSIYLWNNQLNKDKEYIMISKTTPELEKIVLDRIKSLHPYDVPCILTIDIQSGNEQFLDWVNSIKS